jgi:hypothetical protein
MRCRFAGGRRTVVAVRTGTRYNASVIKRCRFPCCRSMATIAALRGWQVSSRFAASNRSVVACCTGAQRDAAMIKVCRFPSAGAVAGIAGLGSR